MITVMSKFKFQKQLPEILALYNSGLSCAEIAREVGSNPYVERDAQCIRTLLRNQGIDLEDRRKIVITNEIGFKIKDLFHQGYSPLQIAKCLNIKEPTVGSYLQKNNLYFRPSPGNIHYFEHIDTYAKAYILGFIAADGALVPAKSSPTITLTITIKYEDNAILDFIKSEIGCTHNIIDIHKLSSFDKTKMIHHSRLSFSIPQIVQDIQKYGITPRKSLSMENIIQNIPYQFRDAFIIGYFDGDGSVHIEENHINSKGYLCKNDSLYINIRGTKPFLEGICEHLGIAKTHIYQHDSIPNLAFANKKDTYRFFQCYTNIPFYYKRKHDRFLQRVNLPSYDKYKQVQTISSSVN